MLQQRHRFTLGLHKFVDILLVMLSFGLATVLVVHAKERISLAAFLSMRAKISNVLLFGLVLFVFHLCFRAFGMYRSRRMSAWQAELADMFRAILLGLLFLVAVGVLFSLQMITPFFLVTFFVTTTIILCGSRLLLRFALGRIRARGRNTRNLLIFGTNARAISFARSLAERPEQGYRLLGFVDNDWGGMPTFQQSGFPIIADYNSLADYLRHNIVDEAVIYLPFASFFHHWSRVADLCAHHGIILRLNSDAFGLDKARWLAGEVEGSHYIATHTGLSGDLSRAIKRLLDIAISAVAIVAFSPLLLVVAIAIKLTSLGPVLFLQDRVGLNKRRFKIWKFRTMVANAEMLMATLESKNEVTGPVFKMKNDPRITSVGGFLRRSSIDELPQLFNVLIGDMSLVGPRPLPIRDYEGFNEDWQRRRFSVKPGITCLWQVNGRSGISFDQWMLLDLKYMDEWSLWLDLKILAKTLPAVWKGQGAA